MRYEPTRATDPGPGWRTRRPPPSYEETRGEDPTRPEPCPPPGTCSRDGHGWTYVRPPHVVRSRSDSLVHSLAIGINLLFAEWEV
jgi:hypothetical protein